MTDTSRPCSVLGFAPAPLPMTDIPDEGKDEGVWIAVSGEDANVPGEDANVPGEDTNVPLRSHWSTAAECILEPKNLGPIICSIICIVLLSIYQALQFCPVLLILFWRERCCPGERAGGRVNSNGYGS